MKVALKTRMLEYIESKAPQYLINYIIVYRILPSDKKDFKRSSRADKIGGKGEDYKETEEDREDKEDINKEDNDLKKK